MRAPADVYQCILGEEICCARRFVAWSRSTIRSVGPTMRVDRANALPRAWIEPSEAPAKGSQTATAQDFVISFGAS
jgi:hypothetical protein